MKMTTEHGDAECEVCGDYAMVHIQDRSLCGPCFRVVATLRMKRTSPNERDVRELINYLCRERGEPRQIDVVRLLRAAETARQTFSVGV